MLAPNLAPPPVGAAVARADTRADTARCTPGAPGSATRIAVIGGESDEHRSADRTSDSHRPSRRTRRLPPRAMGRALRPGPGSARDAEPFWSQAGDGRRDAEGEGRDRAVPAGRRAEGPRAGQRRQRPRAAPRP